MLLQSVERRREREKKTDKQHNEKRIHQRLIYEQQMFGKSQKEWKIVEFEFD